MHLSTNSTLFGHWYAQGYWGNSEALEQKGMMRLTASEACRKFSVLKLTSESYWWFTLRGPQTLRHSVLWGPWTWRPWGNLPPAPSRWPWVCKRKMLQKVLRKGLLSGLIVFFYHNTAYFKTFAPGVISRGAQLGGFPLAKNFWSFWGAQPP